MADLNARIKPKKSSTASEVPLASDLEVAEIAVNTADGKLFTKHTDNSIKEIGGGGGGGATAIDDLTDVDTSTTPPTDGQVLTWDNANSQWEPANAPSGGATAIDDLTDVDTTTVAPTDGQALVWNNGASQWEPGGVSGEIEWTLTANGTTDYIFAGPGFAGTETDPVVYVMRGQTYKFTNTMGVHPFQIQSTQGAGGTIYNDGITNNAVSNGTLTWEVRMDSPSTLYYQCTSHADMNGTIYVLDNNGAVSSVNSLTGAVSLGIEDMDDFEYALAPGSESYILPGPSNNNPSTSGQWGVGSLLNNYFTWFTSDSINSWLSTVTSGTTIEFVTEGGYVHQAVTSTGATTNGPNSDYLSFSGYPWPTEILNAQSANESLKVQTPTIATVNPTDGQVVTWVNDRLQWEPVSLPVPPVDSVNSLTGAVSLGIEDMDDFRYALDPNSESYILSGPSSSNPSASGQWGVGANLNNYFTWFTSDTINSWLSTVTIGTTIEFVTEGGYVHQAVTSTGATTNGANSDYISFSGYSWPTEIFNAQSAGESITVQEPNIPSINPTDGQAITWNNAASKWEPGDVTDSIDNFGDVDTSTVAPSNGDILQYDGSNWVTGVGNSSIVDGGNWESGTSTGGGLLVDGGVIT